MAFHALIILAISNKLLKKTQEYVTFLIVKVYLLMFYIYKHYMANKLNCFFTDKYQTK